MIGDNSLNVMAALLRDFFTAKGQQIRLMIDHIRLGAVGIDQSFFAPAGLNVVLVHLPLILSKYYFDRYVFNWGRASKVSFRPILINFVRIRLSVSECFTL